MKPGLKRISIVLALPVFLLTAGCATPGKGGKAVPEAGRILVASFNIQIFGQSKIGDPAIMEILARIVRRYDIVAIQEVRSKKQDVIPALLEYVNADGHKYDYLISARLGRTGSKEQYAFIYNTETVSVLPGGGYAADDPDDIFEREPFVGYFKSGNFDFKIVNNHIKPDDAAGELCALAGVINAIYDGSPEKDVITVGDMNADGGYYNENNLSVVFPQWIQLIGNGEDTTVGRDNYTYDRIMTRSETADVEYTGSSGVFRWDEEYGVQDAAFIKRVSDHYPVYAEFRIYLPDDD